MASKKKSGSEIHVVIRGVDLPGASCGVPEGMRYENIHVGLQKKGDEVIDLVRGDAASAVWTFTIERSADGDVKGPFVNGKKGDRFLYLSWSGVLGTAHSRFRRAKLMFDAVTDAQWRAAEKGATLEAKLSLTMANGTPLCAAVRPPRITWSTH